MKLSDIAKFIVALFLIGVLSQSMACEVQDDAGHIIQLSHPASRIISLAPDLTELLFAVGAGNKLIGVVEGSDFPEAARHLPVVATYHSLNEEAVLGLHPDLIVAWSGNSAAQLARLSRLSAPIFVSYQRNLSDIPKTMRKLGCLAGTQQTADFAAERFTQQLDALQMRHQNQSLVRVFYQVSLRPLMTINRESWINQVITLCGGQNVFADARMIAPVVSREALILTNPDVILGVGAGEWLAWPLLRAVQNKSLFAVTPDLLERAGPRLLLGASLVCQDLARARQKMSLKARRE
jgi:iron complex transport system substrate-binding protein